MLKAFPNVGLLVFFWCFQVRQKNRVTDVVTLSCHPNRVRSPNLDSSKNPHVTVSGGIFQQIQLGCMQNDVAWLLHAACVARDSWGWYQACVVGR